MSKQIILIHGRNQKPARDDLFDIWKQAIGYGIARDYGSDALSQFEKTRISMAYYGHLSNAYLNLPEENPQSRYDSLKALKQFETNQFNLNTYESLPGVSSTGEALADLFSGILSASRLGRSAIEAVAPDMAAYWDKESYFASDVRASLLPYLIDALASGDKVMLIAHSLGTMISYDNLWKLSHYGEYRMEFGAAKKLDLFVTLGSPLGDENVKRELKGASSKGFLKYPANIRRWINIAAEDDYISHDSILGNDYEEMSRLSMLDRPIKDISRIYNLCVRNEKSNPHSSIGYLIHPKLSKIIHNWLNS